MSGRNEIIKEIELRLGGQMVDIELDPSHYDLAITKALEKYRQRSENSVEERFEPLNILPDINTYTLDSDIVEVKDIYQRTSGATSNGQGVEIEPFQAQYLNSFLLQSGRAGGLAVYDAMMQQFELMGLMFGAEYLFTWDRTNKQLIIHRRPKTDSDVFLHVYKYRPEDDLFADTYAYPWLKDYALAQSKLMLGEARRKFPTIAGPQGGTSLNGDGLIQDGLNELAALEEDLKNFKEGGAGLGFIIG